MVITGQKTFITGGINADFVIVVTRTDPGAGSKGFSLIVVETGTPGFPRGRKLDKIGLHAQDTAELFFDNVRVPVSNLLGTEGRGFIHLMERLPRERMSIAAASMSSSEALFTETKRYCFQRKAFGKPIGDLQNTRFVLAEIPTEIDVTRAYVDTRVLALNAGSLSAVDAAKAKWWASELQKRVIDRSLLHGGYGYMLEYPVARAFVDSRVQTIYGGTTEIMKEIIRPGHRCLREVTSTSCEEKAVSLWRCARARSTGKDCGMAGPCSIAATALTTWWTNPNCGSRSITRPSAMTSPSLSPSSRSPATAPASTPRSTGSPAVLMT
jgi:alkylation response protein AidB-like acyl-CoA dehydrogenase